MIHVLDQELANKIAAGEVVERPGSVIKELVENAMDAGAEHITVEIKNGGVTYMRVTDDGCGMNFEDAHSCFLRHATSKIQNIADLYAIETLGFRGEALAAISAVSKIELLTSCDGVGTRLVLEGGREVSCDEIGAPQGTTIIVRELFYNTPARMKFLKTDRAEGGYIAALMDRLAISNPQISFKLIQDEKVVLNTAGNGKLIDVIYAVMGKDVAKGMLKADTSLQQIHVYGYVAEPAVTKPNRNYQLCYINGRLVRSQTVFAAIDQAYKNDLFHGRHAVCVLKLTLPYGLVDVNVHPSKMEVKFSNEKVIFEAVYYAIKNALNKQTMLKAEEGDSERKEVIPQVAVAHVAKTPDTLNYETVTVFDKPQPILETPQPLSEKSPVTTPKTQPAVEKPKTIFETVTNDTASAEEKDGYAVTMPFNPPPKPVVNDLFSVSNHVFHEEPKAQIVTESTETAAVILDTKDEAAKPLEPEQQTIVEEREELNYRYIGEVFLSYLLVEYKDQMYLIDKHAAHERMIFERLLAENQAESRAQQQLLVPEMIRLSPEEIVFALENADLFQKIGFTIDSFGERQIALRSRPVCLTNESATAAFLEILTEWIGGGNETMTEREITALKTVSCKAAIKAGNLNESDELKKLVADLIREDQAHQCPHGRPVLISYSKKTIEKAFKRI